MIGRRISFFDHIDSTNLYIKKHHQEFQDGDIVLAQMQTSGRGRRNHTWASPRGNLYVSFYMEDKPFSTAFDVIMLFSNSLIELLQRYNIVATIKYPNDIVVGTRKISGILIEHIQDAYVVGVGLNVIDVFLGNHAIIATSIEHETSKKHDYRDILQSLIDVLNDAYKRPETWYEKYVKHSFVIDKHIHYDSQKCLIKGIDSNGRLVLECDNSHYNVALNELSLKELYDE